MEEVLANDAFQVVQKLESLFIWDIGERVVWAVTFKDRVDARVGAVKAKGVHVLPKSRVSKKGLDLGEVSSVQNARDFSLREHSETFVEPEVFPVSARNVIAGPRVGDLMSGDVNLGLVTDDNSRRGKRQKWVLHATEWE